MGDGAPLTCRELVELVTDYLENRLSAIDRARFEAHLAACGDCRAYLMQMRQTLRALGYLTEDLISPQSRAALLQLFRDWKRD